MIKYNNSTINDWNFDDSNIKKVYYNNDVCYQKITNETPTPPPTPIDYENEYLTFVALESGTFKFSGNSINYSLDNGEAWTSLASDTNSPTVNAGDKIMWKATLTPNSTRGVGRFSSTGNYNVEGNAMSLLYGDNFSGQTSLSGKDYAFRNLFSGSTTLISAENLSLPATTLAQQCYYNMFAYCIYLTTAPELPATTLAINCYSNMFQGCTALTTAPELPATTLTDNCYGAMFYGCTSLTSAPQLPATTLTDNCYGAMFRGCTSLTTAPVLSATTLANNCYNTMFRECSSLNSVTCLATDISATDCTKNWVRGVASNGTFTKAASMTSWGSGRDGIPSNWTVQDYQT